MKRYPGMISLCIRSIPFRTLLNQESAEFIFLGCLEKCLGIAVIITYYLAVLDNYETMIILPDQIILIVQIILEIPSKHIS